MNKIIFDFQKRTGIKFFMGRDLPSVLFAIMPDDPMGRYPFDVAHWNSKAQCFEHDPANDYPYRYEIQQILLTVWETVPPGFKLCYSCQGLGQVRVWKSARSRAVGTQAKTFESDIPCPICKGSGILDRLRFQEGLPI